MRAGTQTLIQALQALPWATDPDQDDEIAHPLSPLDSDTEDEGEKPEQPLASSIHTIYRPLARSRRMSVGPTRSRLGIPEHTPEEADLSSDEALPSEDEIDAQDFEADVHATPRPVDIDHHSRLFHSKTMGGPSDFSAGSERIQMMRTGSMTTVRVHRRTKLAEKLKEVFDLPDIQEVRAEMPCWLLRSVLLQGYMYLTNSYLCFFAHMPSREDQVLKSGSLSKKAQRTKRWNKHWFVLKNDALSWYQSSSDPYFPHGIVDLRYAITCEPTGEKDFKLRTNQTTVTLSADSVPSREEWVKAIKKVIFKAQNMGDSVKIAIPYVAILDVEKSSAMDFSETIEVKVVDKEPHFALDSYFFAYFHDLPSALDEIREAVRSHRTIVDESGVTHSQGVMDTTAPRASPVERAVSMPNPSDPAKDKAFSSASGFRISSILKPFQESPRPSSSDIMEEFTHISRRDNSSSFVPVTSPGSPSKGLDHMKPFSDSHTYPPSTTSQSEVPNLGQSSSSGSSWSVGVPNWLKGTRTKALFGSTASEPVVKEVYSSPEPAAGSSSQWSSTPGDLAFSVLETPETTLDTAVIERFKTVFAYDDKETLLGYFPGYLFRLLPVYGKLYISTNYFCFKSSGPLTARTRMTLPIRDILALEKSRAARFGHHGLILVIKGHEELFFEFSAEDKRDVFMVLLNRQMEDVRRRLAIEGPPVASPGKREALILEELDVRSHSEVDPTPPVVESMSDSLPAVMFTSASSTFLTFKPTKSMHFTFLTIGSRGDVQPYIALAKGLIADGHRVKIATHGEYQDWIEAYGIEFGCVGGDPAELMRICVDNGTFTVAFLKEGLSKFRGWLDDLLKTSWEACQGTDVLIESPSAMGGYHIAEALSIPYFRAFTMTWSRTRAYPHAFAVPERKMGGSYNYMTYVLFDQVFWRAISGQINRWRKHALHLNSTSLDRMEPHKIPFLYNFSPSAVPPPLDWPEWIRVTGYWFLDSADVSAKKWTPPDDLVKFIETARSKGKKIVYIGFGSIVVSDPRTMTRCVIDAVVQSGVYAILSKGWSDRLNKTAEHTEPEEPLPKQIYSISSIPHDWLFARVDAACHHGGAGTTGASFRAGIPTIIRPFFGDQFFWADRVEALGVGTGVRKLTVETLTEALLAATSDQKQIDRARLMGEQIRKEDGVATAIEAIYRDLEYARSLIKQPMPDSDTEEELDEHGTIRHSRPSSSGLDSSNESAKGASSEDWSVISEQDERRSSFGSPERTKHLAKRNSLTTAVLSVLPDAFIAGSPRRRTVSTSQDKAS
ncbi:glycosyltransferase family 1 protein [Mycena floridula]|nr:glycosyltransferase family 1 protein [Mycena floridula]